MQKKTINKIVYFISNDDVQNLIKMKLSQKTDINQWIGEFYNYAVEHEKYNAAKYMCDIMLSNWVIEDYYRDLFNSYINEPENLSFLRELIVKYVILSGDDDILDFAKTLIDKPKELNSFIIELQTHYDEGFLNIFSKLINEVIFNKEFTEEQCITGLDVLLSFSKKINEPYNVFGGDDDLFKYIINTRTKCKNILALLEKHGYKVPVNKKGYSSLATWVVEDKNIEAIEFLLNHGADFTVPKNSLVLSAYDIGYFDGFWKDNQELAQLVLKDKSLDYKSESIKAHEAFVKEDFKTYIELIKHGAALMDTYIEAESTVRKGCLVKCIELSSKPEYYNVAKEILDEAERRGLNKTEIMVDFSKRNPINFSKCIDLGLDPNVKNDEGIPSGFYSCSHFLGYEDILSVIKELVNKGCDMTYVDKEGESLLDKVINSYSDSEEITNFELIDYLYSMGCTINNKTLIEAIKHPFNMEFFNKINEYFDWSDMPQDEFDNLIPHFEEMIEHDKHYNQTGRTNLNNYLKNKMINQCYVDGQEKLIKRREHFIELYGQVIEKIKNMDSYPRPTM